MGIPARTIEVMRTNHRKVMKNTIGILNITYRSNTADYNIYHDKTADSLGSSITTFGYIEISPPIKTVQQLGWWREGESLPILCYLPWEEGMLPKKDDQLVVATEGVLAGEYQIDHVKQYGQGEAISWILNIHKDRQ